MSADIEQGNMSKLLLINQEIEWIKLFCSISSFLSISEQFCHVRHLLDRMVFLEKGN